MAAAIGSFSSIQIEKEIEKKRLAMLQKELDIESILAMDQDGDGVDKIEFLTAMLVQMNGLDKEKHIDIWLKVSICYLYICRMCKCLGYAQAMYRLCTGYTALYV